MRTSLQFLVHFIQQEFLEIHYYNTKFRVRNLNSEIKINISDKQVGPERAGTHDKRATSLPTPISKYVLRIISL